MSYTAIGGYFGFELRMGETFPHSGATLVNSGRNALEFILKTMQRQPATMWIPYYTCEVLLQPLRKLGIQYEFYNLNNHLEVDHWPELKADEYIIVNNYFGIKDHYIRQLACDRIKLPHLIIDESQAWYSHEILSARQFYSPRKFFGVPDGGVAFTPVCNEIELEQGTSFDRCSHLLKRIDLGATEGYEDFQTNDGALDNVPLMAMSPLTNAILSGVNYEDVKHRRRRNFEILHQALTTSNRLAIPDMSGFECPMVYPYWCDDPALRKRLIADNIFVATYWPNVLEWCAPGTLEQDLTLNLLPLPIDQRYGVADMKKIIDRITK